MSIPLEEKKQVRKAIRRLKELKIVIKPLDKEYSELHDWVKEMVMKNKKDFEFADGGTSSFPTVREYYDTKMLDEMIDNETFDADTAALIRKTRKKTESITTRIV